MVQYPTTRLVADYILYAVGGELVRSPTFVQVRTVALFFGGMAGAAYVTLIDQTDRPTLLILFGAMMGLPLFLRADEKHQVTLPPPPPPPGIPSGAEDVDADD